MSDSNRTIDRQGYKVSEAAYILGIGKTKTYELIRGGDIRAVKFGTRTIVPRAEIVRLLNAPETDPDNRAA